MADIWSKKQGNCLYNFGDRGKEIYAVRWSPTCQGTNNPNWQLVLASVMVRLAAVHPVIQNFEPRRATGVNCASADSTIKLWNPEKGCLLCSLNGHSGEYLASGSPDCCLRIWSVKEGKILKTYSVGGIIFDVNWNKVGDKIAACLSNSNACIADFRM